MQNVVGRLAPSPSGEMHLGNALAALLAWLSARSQGGRVLLRLEDLDKPRCPARFGLGVMDDLAWLGLDWDNEPVWQSAREDGYERCLATLEEQGLLYPCYCTRKELHSGPGEASAPHGQSPVYSRRCLHLTEEERRAMAMQGRSAAIRIRVPETVYSLVDGCQGRYEAQLDVSCGDFILKRSDGLYAYQLAVVADDGEMGVTEVVRGRDLLPSTPQQLFLQDRLGFAHPRYYHTPLLLAADGRRLSKREGDLSLKALSRQMSSLEVVGWLAHRVGLQAEPRPISPAELLADFSWERVVKQDVTVT